eukprot:s1759_g9.t1
MNYQYDIAEVPASINCSLMQGCFEVPWQQNPTIFVLLEFQYLRIYDSQGPTQVLDNTEIKDPALPKPIKFDFNILNAVMMRCRTVAARLPSRMRSISELKVREYVQGKEADQKVTQLTAAYLTSVVENPDSQPWIQAIGSNLLILSLQQIAFSMFIVFALSRFLSV